jgi:hypothetical protein
MAIDANDMDEQTAVDVMNSLQSSVWHGNIVIF